METIYKDEMELYYEKEIAQGTEGRVFLLYDETAFKKYNLPFTSNCIKGRANIEKNKINKLEILSTIAIEGFVTQTSIVLNNEGSLSGVTMNYVNPNLKTPSFYNLYTETIKTKLEYFKKLQSIIERIAEYNLKHPMNRLVIWDFNPDNFMIDKSGNVHLIDTDGIQVGKYSRELIVCWQSYFDELFCHKDYVADRYLYGLSLLSFLLNLSFDFYHGKLITEVQLRALINCSQLPKDIKQFFEYYFFAYGYYNGIGNELDSLNEHEYEVGFDARKYEEQGYKLKYYRKLA